MIDMAILMNGEIVSISPDIMDNIETVLEFVRSLDENDEYPPKGIMEKAQRIEAYLATYRSEEEKYG